MASFVLQATVAATSEAVFAVLSDPARQPALFAGAAPDVPVAPGPVRQGSRLRRTRTVGSQTFSGEATIDAFRPPRELAITGESRGVRVETRWRLAPATPDGRATKIDYECRVSASGLASMFEGAILEALRRADADHLERLRKLVER